MRHEFLKFIVQPVVIERADDGSITGERVGEPTPAYSREQLIEFADAVLRELGVQNNGSVPGVVVPKRDIIMPG